MEMRKKMGGARLGASCRKNRPGVVEQGRDTGAGAPSEQGQRGAKEAPTMEELEQGRTPATAIQYRGDGTPATNRKRGKQSQPNLGRGELDHQEQREGGHQGVSIGTAMDGEDAMGELGHGLCRDADLGKLAMGDPADGT
uniref:Uncharacterized protein n=1 Tax=Zea mays TaxID=4577 RepID=A0A804QW10_MAIZE